jgi:hypothetical protein
LQDSNSISAQSCHICVTFRTDDGANFYLVARLDSDPFGHLDYPLVEDARTLDVELKEVWSGLIAYEEQVFEPFSDQQRTSFPLPL